MLQSTITLHISRATKGRHIESLRVYTFTVSALILFSEWIVTPLPSFTMHYLFHLARRTPWLPFIFVAQHIEARPYPEDAPTYSASRSYINRRRTPEKVYRHADSRPRADRISPSERSATTLRARARTLSINSRNPHLQPPPPSHRDNPGNRVTRGWADLAERRYCYAQIALRMARDPLRLESRC